MSSTQAAHDVVVRVDKVDKHFTVRHTRSLKDLAVNLIKGKDDSNTYQALKSVTFDINSGESVALLGLNGSGKSTLLKVISGVVTPDGGYVGIAGRVAGLIEVGAGFHPDLTARENVYLNGAILGMTREQIDNRFDSIWSFADIDDSRIDQEVKYYSSGMFLRLAFSVSVHSDPDIFLIDEILSVGDEPFQKRCIARVKELIAEGRTLVVVSHDLEMVKKVCDRAIVLRQGDMVFDGPIDEGIDLLRHSHIS